MKRFMVLGPLFIAGCFLVSCGSVEKNGRGDFFDPINIIENCATDDGVKGYDSYIKLIYNGKEYLEGEGYTICSIVHRIKKLDLMSEEVRGKYFVGRIVNFSKPEGQESLDYLYQGTGDIYTYCIENVAGVDCLRWHPVVTDGYELEPLGDNCAEILLCVVSSKHPVNARLWAMSCIQKATGRYFDLAPIVDNRRVDAEALKIREWIKKSKTMSKKEIGCELIRDGNLLVKFSGAIVMVEGGNKLGLFLLAKYMKDIARLGAYPSEINYVKGFSERGKWSFVWWNRRTLSKIFEPNSIMKRCEDADEIGKIADGYITLIAENYNNLVYDKDKKAFTISKNGGSAQNDSLDKQILESLRHNNFPEEKIAEILNGASDGK